MTMPAAALTTAERITSLEAEVAVLRAEVKDAKNFVNLMAWVHRHGRFPTDAELLASGMSTEALLPSPAIPGVGVTSLRVLPGGAS